MKKNLLYLILAILTLPIVLTASQQVQQLLGLAAPTPANIVIDTQTKLGTLENIWAAFAQGGEEPPPMLNSVVPNLRILSPRYIRLDHIFDSYNVVKRKDNSFEYDFSQLDKTVEDIIATGALPFFSLSYMPREFTTSSSIIDVPSDWNWWKDLVKETINHYSGKNEKNLNNVYYEVWNEPELPQFGEWKLTGDKDYRLLYFHAAMGASQATDVNTFYLGGPAVGSYYLNWVDNFISYVSQNNLRLDFYSWHRYTRKPNEYLADAKMIRKNLAKFSRFTNIPLIVSEWGIESANSVINNSNAAAAFSVSAISKFHSDLNLAFAFEVKDGPPPTGGKWGLLTHERDEFPLSPKPRFLAFEALTNLTGDKLAISGEGTYVSGLSSKSDQTVYTIITNYDVSDKNTESVPVTFTGLPPSSYNLKYNYVLENRNSGGLEVISTEGVVSKTFLMPPNSILFLELIPLSPLATFISGKSGQSLDKALVLQTGTSPLTFTSPEFSLRTNGSLGFDIKPFWEESDNSTFLIFEAPYSTTSAFINRLFLAKQKKPEGNVLTLGIASNKEDLALSIPITGWQKDTWHNVESNWDHTGLWLTIDDLPTIKKEASIDIRNGEILSFYPIDAALDNLKIILGGEQIIERVFDGTTDK